MLGDTGSNLVGALAGLWLVLTLSTLGLAIATALLVIRAGLIDGDQVALGRDGSAQPD